MIWLALFVGGLWFVALVIMVVASEQVNSTLDDVLDRVPTEEVQAGYTCNADETGY